MTETPEDAEVVQALKDAQMQLNKQQGDDQDETLHHFFNFNVLAMQKHVCLIFFICLDPRQKLVFYGVEDTFYGGNFTDRWCYSIELAWGTN